MGQVHGGPRVALILPVSPLTPLRHLRCARVPRLSLSLHLSPPRRAPLFPLSCRCTCHRIRSLAIVVVTVMPVMVVVGRYLLRRGWGIRKIEKRKDKKRVPTTHALAPSLSLPLRLVKGWRVTLYPESGPMKRERYTCTNTSTRRIVRDAVLSSCVRVNIPSKFNEWILLAVEKPGGDLASWRRSEEGSFPLVPGPFVPLNGPASGTRVLHSAGGWRD